MSVPRSIIDLVFGFLILLMTYALSSEGLWGAALMFFNVLFGGLIAFNFYEPLARLIDSTGIGWGFSDTLSHARDLLRLGAAPAHDHRDPRPGDGPVPDARSTTRAGSSSPWARRWSRWRSSSSRSTPRRCTRRSSGPSTTRTNRRSGWGSTTSGWASSSTRPARSSPATAPAGATRTANTAGAATRGSRCRSSIPRAMAPGPSGGPALREAPILSRKGRRWRGGRGAGAGRHVRAGVEARPVLHREAPASSWGTHSADRFMSTMSRTLRAGATLEPEHLNRSAVAKSRFLNLGGRGPPGILQGHFSRPAPVRARERISMSSSRVLDSCPTVCCMDPVDGDLVRGGLEDVEGCPARAVAAQRSGGHEEVRPGPLSRSSLKSATRSRSANAPR